jgi:plastocyanin domain-containing protein
MNVRLCLTMTLATLLAVGCSKQEPAGKADPVKATAAGRVDINVTENGFEPAAITVKQGVPVTLAFTRKTDKTCATEVIVDLGDGHKVDRPLPLDKTVEIAATFTKTGQLRYACGMDMVSGVVTVN